MSPASGNQSPREIRILTYAKQKLGNSDNVNDSPISITLLTWKKDTLLSFKNWSIQKLDLQKHSGRERGHRVVPIRFPTRCVQNSNFWTKYVGIDYKLNFCKLFFSTLTPPGAPGGRKGWNSKFGHFWRILTSKRHFFWVWWVQNHDSPPPHIYCESKKLSNPKKVVKWPFARSVKFFSLFPKFQVFMFMSFFHPQNDFWRQKLLNSNKYIGNFWSLGLERFEKMPNLRPQRPNKDI